MWDEAGICGITGFLCPLSRHESVPLSVPHSKRPINAAVGELKHPRPVRKLLRPGTVALPGRIRGYVKEQPFLLMVR
jgi:hypothetical protein